ncbi:2Fe-2S iron-sulfur cluster binding domain-containing protein [Pontibacterium sp. N1Y112]|uniref:2Fe-2S iron-sulfur cluster binding domain-containing protein n=1 Tax=Pontibacterium sinense TaxID=2781979 RepID=A0A8J7JY00_9GAMM|nr:2Fe-2S iron-sulfur cluster binding domain-containing protein [Pontibacterium sinense]
MSDTVFLLHLNDEPQPVTVRTGESLLEALESAGYRMRKSCRNGVCEICEIGLQRGTVKQRYPSATYNNNNAAENVRVLACTATPLTDVWVNIEGLIAPGEQSVKKLVCDIKGIESLNHDVYRVRLQLPATGSLAIEFNAGQYLDVVLPDGKQASFSIGSAPEQGRDLELHIRHIPDSDMSNAIMDHLKSESTVELELPKGDCFLQAKALNPDTHFIFGAASTGFAQVKSVVEHLLANQVPNPITIYWGARIEEDMYLERLPQQWEAEHANLTFVPVVSEPENSPNWKGRTGLLPEAVLEDFSDLSGVEIFASGSPAMVYALLDAAETRGFNEKQMHSDVFAYAPRG